MAWVEGTEVTIRWKHPRLLALLAWVGLRRSSLHADRFPPALRVDGLDYQASTFVFIRAANQQACFIPKVLLRPVPSC